MHASNQRPTCPSEETGLRTTKQQAARPCFLFSKRIQPQTRPSSVPVPVSSAKTGTDLRMAERAAFAIVDRRASWSWLGDRPRHTNNNRKSAVTDGG